MRSKSFTVKSVKQSLINSLILIAVFLAASSQAQVQVQISDVKTVTETVTVSTETVRTVTDTGQVIGDPVITVDRGVPVIDAGAPAKLMEIKTDAVNVQLRVTDISRLPVEFEIIGDNQFLLNTPGKQWVDLTVVDFDKNIFFLNTYVVEVEGATPGPDPPAPEPPGPPDGEPPIEGPGLRVLFVAESSEGMPREIEEAFYSKQVSDYLAANCVKVDGVPDFRRVDPDTQYTDANHRFAKALARPRESLPWLIISNGVTGYEGPFPGGVTATMELLRSMTPTKAPPQPVMSAAESRPVVTIYSLPTCAECQRFIAQEVPLMPEVEFRIVEGGASSYPTYQIEAYGRRTYLGGRVNSVGMRYRIAGMK